jgi:hypothetical protein
LVCSSKGIGSRGTPKTPGKRGVYEFTGSVSQLLWSDLVAKQSALTQRALRLIDAPRILTAQAKGNAGVKPVPVPKRVGEPSLIEHVVYVLKENRTYDEVLGGLAKGNGDKRFVLFGRDVTPNHHALAEEFVLLDNFYCNGVLSADGHAWAMEGNATSYLERSFGGFTRSYPFGDDPLSYSSTGFIWDRVLAAGKSFRNFGEFNYTEPSPKATFTEIFADFKAGRKRIAMTPKIGVGRLRNYTNLKAPGWNMAIPDVWRAAVFLEEFEQWKARGSMPNLTLIYLPQDHGSGSTVGFPTPRAHMADNDLALGQIVQAISRSKFWAKTAIFVMEDDPQAGLDHVDGHRSPGYVISPYTRTGKVVSNFYNQTSMLATMLRILGAAPLNQMDARSPLMTACFVSKPNLKPYVCRTPKQALDEMNPNPRSLTGEHRRIALMADRLDLSVPDRCDEDLLNRMVWHSVRGNQRYPAEWAGAHGRGLKAKGLKLDPNAEDDDD